MSDHPQKPQLPGHRSRRQREIIRLREECSRLIAEIERLNFEAERIADKLRELAR